MEPFGVTAEPLDVQALAAFIADSGAGAIVTFLGVSRESSNDANQVERPVETLWYEAYGPMALRKLREIGAETTSRFDIRGVACWHRTGEVAIGEASVAIAVSAPHRGDAFDACRFVIEQIKTSLPVWKRERFADGEEWVEGYGGEAGSARA